MSYDDWFIEEGIEARARGFPSINRMRIHDLAKSIAVAAKQDQDTVMLDNLVDALNYYIQDEQLHDRAFAP
jgi:hypothetical protein